MLTPPILVDLLLAHTSDLISLHDPDGTFRWASAAAESVLGLAPEALVGRSGLAFVHPADQPRVRAELAARAATPFSATDWRTTQRTLRADGAVIWLESRFQRLPPAIAADDLVLVVSRDVTARVQAEQAVEAQQALIAAAFEESLVGMTILQALRDPATGQVIDFWLVQRNRRAREQTRLLNDSAPIGPTGLTLLQRQPVSAARVFAHFRSVVETGQPWEGESIRPAAGGERWYQNQVVRLSAEQICVSWLDLTPARLLETRVAEEQRLFQTIFDSSAAGLSIFAAVRDEETGAVVDFTIRRRNRQALHLLNLTQSDEGARMSQQYPLMMTNGLFTVFQRVLLTGSSWHDEVRYQEASIDGWYEVYATRLDSNQICLSFTDQTVVRRTEARLAEIEAQLLLGADLAGVGMSERDLATGQVRFSAQYATICGLPPTTLEMRLSELMDRVHPDDRLSVRDRLDTGQVTVAADHYETRFRFRRFSDSAERTLLTRARLVRDGVGRPVRMLAATIDITDTAEQVARTLAAETRLSLATEIVGLGIAERLVENAMNGPITVSAEYARILGLPADQAVLPVSDVIALFDPDDMRNRYEPYLQALLLGERPAPLRLRARRADTGAALMLLALVRVVPDSPARFQSAIIDITGIVEAEQRAFEMQAQLALATEVAGLGLSSRDLATGEVMISPAFAALYGFESARQTVPLAALLAQTHPDDLRQIRPDFEARTEQLGRSHQVQYRIIRADNGQERTLLASARTVPDASGNPARLVAATLDITDLIQSRAAAEQMANWQRLIDGLPEILWVAAGNDANQTRLLNRRWYEYTGQTPAVLIDQSWSTAFHPADLADPVLMRDSSVQIAKGEPYEVKFRLRSHEGFYRWFLSRAAPVRDDSGAISNWVGLTMDVHEREMAEKALRRANTDLDTFVYAAAHDLKNPIDNLEVIIGNLQEELQERRQLFASPNDEAQDELIRHAIQSIGRFRTTLADLAQVVETQSASRDEPRAALDLATYAADLVLDMETEFANAQGVLCLDLRVPALPVLPPRHLRSLLFNLIGNSLKYRFPGRPARLWLRSRKVGAAWVELSLTDNGLGLDAQRATRAFELFGRLHPGAAGGTGIGLFIVRRIVEQAGGQLRVNGRVGEGTTFSVRIPVE